MELDLLGFVACTHIMRHMPLEMSFVDDSEPQLSCGIPPCFSCVVSGERDVDGVGRDYRHMRVS